MRLHGRGQTGNGQLRPDTNCAAISERSRSLLKRSGEIMYSCMEICSRPSCCLLEGLFELSASFLDPNNNRVATLAARCSK
jgi:hypothetical protein